MLYKEYLYIVQQTIEISRTALQVKKKQYIRLRITMVRLCFKPSNAVLFENTNAESIMVLFEKTYIWTSCYLVSKIRREHIRDRIMELLLLTCTFIAHSHC